MASIKRIYAKVEKITSHSEPRNLEITWHRNERRKYYVGEQLDRDESVRVCRTVPVYIQPSDYGDKTRLRTVLPDFVVYPPQLVLDERQMVELVDAFYSHMTNGNICGDGDGNHAVVVAEFTIGDCELVYRSPGEEEEEEAAQEIMNTDMARMRLS